MNTCANFATQCRYRENGIQCGSGLLYDSVILEPVTLDGATVNCPACEGTGTILTKEGRELISFLQTAGKPFLRAVLDELLEERKRD